MVEHISDISFSPQEAGRLSVDMVQSLSEKISQGVVTGIGRIDKKYVPDRSGELITVLGRPGNGKSQWLNHMSKQALKTIQPESNEIVLRATWEQSIEEDTLVWLAGDTSMSITQLARGDVGEKEFKILRQSAMRRALVPMWIIGHSSMSNRQERRIRPRMTMANLGQAIEYVCNDATPTKWKPKAIFLDYLQRIRPEGSGDRRIQLMDIVDQSKDLAIAMDCPVYLGVQAKREVDERMNKIPEMGDGQETSNIEQSSDKMWGLWYPWKTEDDKSRVAYGLPLTQNLFFAKLLKQKLGESGDIFPLHAEMAYNKITEMARPSDYYDEQLT